MKKFFTFLIIVLSSLTASAQPPDSLWSRLYGGTGTDFCGSVKQTLDGGYVFAGQTNYSPTDVDAWMVKTDASGNIEWSRTSGGTQMEAAQDVVQRAGGTGYAMAGNTNSYGSGDWDFYVVRVSNSGVWQGHSYFGGTLSDVCSSIRQTSDGGYILGGATQSSGAGSADFWLVKTDSAGSYSWGHTFGGTGFDWCYATQPTADGYIMAGKTASFGSGQNDMWLVKTNSSGQSQWSRTYGGTNLDECYAIVQSQDGGYVLAGSTRSFGSGSADFYLVKTDANGTMQWDRWYGGPGIEVCRSVQRTLDGGYILAGKTSSWGAGNADMWLLKVSSTGDSMWSRTLGGSESDECFSVQQCSDGSFILGGETSSFGAVNGDIWLVKIGREVSADNPFFLAPSSFILSAYPNPFNPATTISYDLPKAGHISLRVFDLLGREVAVLKDGFVEAGSHRVIFDGKGLASGIYFARLDAAEFSQTKKLMLLR